jgi:hypothetical protein
MKCGKYNSSEDVLTLAENGVFMASLVPEFNTLYVSAC